MLKNHPTLKIFSIYMIVLLIIYLFSSCNTVQRTLNKVKNNPEVYKAVERYVIVERKACINDTIVVTKDSVIYNTRDLIIRDTISSPCPDFDKTLSSGIRVISKNGNLKVEVPVKYNEKETIRTVTNNIRDIKLENILREERNEALDKYARSEKQRDSLEKENKELKSIIKAKDRKYTFTLIGIGLVGLIFVVLKIKKILPF